MGKQLTEADHAAVNHVTSEKPLPLRQQKRLTHRWTEDGLHDGGGN
jgi:hypothetical protein